MGWPFRSISLPRMTCSGRSWISPPAVRRRGWARPSRGRSPGPPPRPGLAGIRPVEVRRGIETESAIGAGRAAAQQDVGCSPLVAGYGRPARPSDQLDRNPRHRLAGGVEHAADHGHAPGGRYRILRSFRGTRLPHGRRCSGPLPGPRARDSSRARPWRGAEERHGQRGRFSVCSRAWI